MRICSVQLRAMLPSKAFCCTIYLLQGNRDQAQHSFSTCSMTQKAQKAQHAQHMKECMFTQATQQGPPALQCTAERLLVCYAKHLLPDYLAANIQEQHSFNTCSDSHAEDACTHKPQNRVSPALQYTAESNACLLCKAFCCLICLLQIFRHSTASAHAVRLRNHSMHSI